jgi:hypothetical protein
MQQLKNVITSEYLNSLLFNAQFLTSENFATQWLFASRSPMLSKSFSTKMTLPIAQLDEIVLQSGVKT